MPVKLVEFKHNLDETFLEMLESLSNYIKENPDDIKSLIFIIQSSDGALRVLNNAETTAINVIGQLELAKLIVIDNVFDDSE